MEVFKLFFNNKTKKRKKRKFSSLLNIFNVEKKKMVDLGKKKENWTIVGQWARMGGVAALSTLWVLWAALRSLCDRLAVSNS